MRFQYSITSPTQNEFDSLPRLSLLLRREDKSVEVSGLVDSGATVNVLSYEIGLRLGAISVISQQCLFLRSLKSENFRQPNCFLPGWIVQICHWFWVRQTFFLNLMFASTVLKWSLKSIHDLCSQPTNRPMKQWWCGTSILNWPSFGYDMKRNSTW